MVMFTWKGIVVNAGKQFGRRSLRRVLANKALQPTPVSLPPPLSAGAHLQR